MGEIVKMAVSLLGVLGLMFLTFFGLRMFNRRISTSGGRLRVIDKAILGRDSMMIVVSVCGKLMLVGVSSQRFEKLTDLDITEEEYIESAFGAAGQNAVVMPFSDILSSFVKTKKNGASEQSDSDLSDLEERQGK